LYNIEIYDQLNILDDYFELDHLSKEPLIRDLALTDLPSKNYIPKKAITDQSIKNYES